MKPNASEDAHKRREAELILIYNNPMSSIQIANILGYDRVVVSNDISCLKRIGLIEVKGKMLSKNVKGHGRTVELVYCKQLYSAEKLKTLSSSKATHEIPDLPNDILLLMGYTSLKPENARVIQNEGFHQPRTKSKRIKVNIPSQFGMFDMANGAW